MENIIHALHRPAHGLAVQNRSLNEFVLEAGEIVLEAGTQIVQHAHLGLALEMFDDVAADEAGAAGDQNFHFKLSPPIGSSDPPVARWIRPA